VRLCGKGLAGRGWLGAGWRLLSVWEPNGMEFVGNLVCVRRFGAFSM
jgi:hypothetical protein